MILEHKCVGSLAINFVVEPVIYISAILGTMSIVKLRCFVYPVHQNSKH